MNNNESHHELSALKQEVADLWRRFRQHEGEQDVGEDPARAQLSEQARVLEGKRKLLVERREVVRAVLEKDRQQASRFVPVVRALGLLLGGVAAMAAAWLALPEVAALSVDFGVAQGAVLLGVSALFPLAIPRA